ncbi:sulfatase family protein [Fodinibius salsisoli]|uniref:Sulfatase n=1 Tax=Fodinibius salsisoli TaxID=2820877 RepID=A0ABT3PQE0_9BACT|nr:sulfatase [Fodinibius salsisoli]MCW9708079.1 sulfatase [Fodinibius salsisoli]
MSMFLVAVVLVGCMGKSGNSSEDPKEKPNIIFIMSDDHAYQAIGSYGSRINKTPNIDRIAEEGMRFENSFVTNSICAPSRAVLLTGKYSHMNGHIDNSTEFDGSQVTFPKILQKNGYETAMIGKWHLKSQPTGFDYWNVLPGQGYYYNPDFIEMGDTVRQEGYVTDLITDVSLNWLKKRKDDQPFLLVLGHKAPHRNWMPGPDHLNDYNGEEIPLPETFYDDYQTRSAAAKEQYMEIGEVMGPGYDLKLSEEEGSTKIVRQGRWWAQPYKRMNAKQREVWDAAYQPRNDAFHRQDLSGKKLEEWKYQRYIKDYLLTIASVDDNVGRVLDYLEEEGLTENTIIVYTSDQGFYLGEHGWFDKRWMYEQSLRMPLLMRYDGHIPAGSVTDQFALNLDFAPTFLDYAGIDITESMQGRSLRPVLENKAPDDWRQSMYYHYYEYPGPHQVKRHYGIRTDRYKLIHFYYDIDAWELYDLKEDPNELNNVYDDSAYADVVVELKQQLDDLREQYGDTEEATERYLPKEDK